MSLRDLYREKCADHNVEPHSLVSSALNEAASDKHLRLVLRGCQKQSFTSRLKDRDLIVLVDTLVFARDVILEFLDVSYNELTSLSLEAVSKLFSEGVQVIRLDISSNDLSEDGFDQFIDAVAESSVHSLNVSYNNLGNKAGFSLARLIQTSKSLQELSANSVEIDTSSLIAIATSIAHNKYIRHLELDNPRLFSYDEETAIHLARAIEQNDSIEFLSLSKHFIGDEGTERLAEHLLKNRSLLHLSLSKNRISQPGAVALATLLLGNVPIQALDLSSNRIADEGACALANALQHNRNLTHLNIRNCAIEEKGLIAIANAVRQNNSIVSLRVWGNEFSRRAASVFYAMMQERQLRDCDVKPNAVDDEIDIVRLE